MLRTCPLALENMALVAEFEVGSPQLRSWNCLGVLDQCSPWSLLATGDLVLDDVVLLTIRKQAFRESEIQPVVVS